MYLKSIELQGFKSFPDKTKLVFDSKGEDTSSGVTVIVGPNGSGKSNIADAMRWVLGEISSKTLRGTKMEDVIFGGADSRRPMGFAEVSVTFDNTDEISRLDCPYDEVTVTRRYFRAGESEYYINRRPVRLRDIYELFMNTGIGRDGYSIIGQGRIAEMVSRKSDERRGIFEDASGIAKYRHKKNDAERKLSQTEENMVRVRDVFAEVEAQVGPLEKEAGKAKRAIELMDTKKKVDVGLWLFDTEKLRADISVAEEALRHSSFDLKNAEDSMQSLDVRNAKLFDASQSGKIASSQILSEIREVTNKLHTLDSEFRVSQSNILHAGELSENAESAMKSYEKSLAEEQEKVKLQNEKTAQLEKTLSELQTELEKAEDDIFEQKCVISELERDIDTAFADGKCAEEVATDIKVRISVLENARMSGSDRNASILSDIEEYEKIHERLGQERISKEKTVSDYDRAIAEADSEIKEKEGILADANNKYGEIFSDMNDKKLKRDAALHRVATIKAMEEQFEGYAHSVKYVMNGYSEGKITDIRGNVCGKIYGPLSKIISVDGKFITAIEVALGANLQNIVVEDEDTAKAAMYYLKRGQAGRATFFPLTSMRPSSETPEMRDAKGFSGYIDTAENLCRREARFDNVISSLLGRTLVFDNIDNATAMARALKYKVRVVTLDGQQINAGGSFTGGSVKSQGGALSRAEEMKTLTLEAHTLDGEIKSLESELNKQKKNIEDATESITDIQDRKELLGVLRNTEASRLEQVIAQSDANKSLLDKMRDDYDQIVCMSERYEEDLASLKEQEKAQNLVIEEISAARMRKHEAKVEAEDRAAELEKSKTELIIRINQVGGDIETSKALLAVSNERISVILSDIEASKARIDSYKTQIENTTTAQAENRREYAEYENLLSELNQKKNKLDEGNLEFEKQLAELNALMREKMSEKEVIFRAHTHNESKLLSLRESYDKLAGRLWEDYELTRNDAVALGYPEVTPENRAECVRIQTDCKNKLRAIGHVDLDAVNKYKEVKERYDYMSVQIKDLESARDELMGIISQLEGEMKVAFTDSFNKINENFAQTFSELFGGGSAELSLTDPDDVLESGIEIKAAPPGKIIKNLMQLSGGEQAFIGVALFFAILKVNPTPFCILDEIEAALDEVNVERLAQYIRRYSDGTQFIMITHRRGTMAAATRLYGVTMPEHGISKVLTLDVRDIEKQKESEWNGLFE